MGATLQMHFGIGLHVSQVLTLGIVEDLTLKQHGKSDNIAKKLLNSGRILTSFQPLHDVASMLKQHQKLVEI